jgi:hypothetical protein
VDRLTARPRRPLVVQGDPGQVTEVLEPLDPRRQHDEQLTGLPARRGEGVGQAGG